MAYTPVCWRFFEPPCVQDPAYRGLALLGLAAVSTSPVAAFSAADGVRLLAVTTQNDPTKAQVCAGGAGGWQLLCCVTRCVQLCSWCLLVHDYCIVLSTPP